MYIGAIPEKRFEYKGFPCVVVMQALCFRTGYVGVPKGHKLYGKQAESETIDCHGGVTYCKHHLIGQEDKDVWWIGYDTGHCFDGYDEESAKKLFKDYPEAIEMIEQTAIVRSLNNYKGATLEYCEEQCRSMVEQIIERWETDE